MKRTPRELARLLSSFGTHLKVTDWGALREAAAYITEHENLLEESERVPEVDASPVVEEHLTTEGA